MNVVTSADSQFFHCLKELAGNVRKLYGKAVIVYDLGLTAEQKESLDAVVLQVSLDDNVCYNGKAYLSVDGHPSTRATHKPFCVKDYFQQYCEPMIFIDADCLFRERVEEHGFDVGVTCARRKKSKIDNCYNGIINSGVIFFNSPAEKLVDKWAKQCLNENTTDQKALSDVLSEHIDWSIFGDVQYWDGLDVKIFDATVYNDYHLRAKSKIIHFITSKHQKDIYEKLIVGYRNGKDIRRMFREIKRGKKSGIKSIAEKIVSIFKTKR